MVQPPRVHNHGKYDNNGKGWYFRFDDENKMSYKFECVPENLPLINRALNKSPTDHEIGITECLKKQLTHSNSYISLTNHQIYKN